MPFCRPYDIYTVPTKVISTHDKKEKECITDSPSTLKDISEPWQQNAVPFFCHRVAFEFLLIKNYSKSEYAFSVADPLLECPCP